MLERAKRFYADHEPACTAGFFVAGFIFDVFAVGRIDKLHNVLHQAGYLLLCGWLTGLEIREQHGGFTPHERFKGAWRYHKAATHFMLGTLLNIYTLFYFKSASLTASLVFLLFWVALLGINEARPFPGSATRLRMTLFSLCLVSYFGYLVPMLAHRLGTLVFLGSLAASTAALALLVWRLEKRIPEGREAVRRLTVVPFAWVAAAFTLMYLAKLIPPVPLSISDIGIYHDARRVGDEFELTMLRPRWRFWERGDQTFAARPGDKIHCFVSVFSPTDFKERLELRWLFKDPAAGWKASDVMPLGVTGGRDEGFRSVTVKSRYQPGTWRVLVETSDGRELGRIGFTVSPDDGTEPREGRLVRR
ncbi:MAG: DUF2914 domain-containing protein [Elusimicrobia bacterium]|nr:DUF2914 domain-containing protein [Elusimicrobiota bacterium]